MRDTGAISSDTNIFYYARIITFGGSIYRARARQTHMRYGGVGYPFFEISLTKRS